MNNKVIIIGAGGHANVIKDIVEKSSDIFIGCLDDNAEKAANPQNHIIGKISDLEKFSDEYLFIIGIGDNCIRKKIAQTYKFSSYTAIHPSSVIAPDVIIGDGSAVMANVVINSGTIIKEHCIINTSSVVEHDNTIGPFSHISPNATLCGTVKVGSLCHIGAAATVINNINIADNTTLGAGAVVVEDITDGGIYVGVPAKRLK